MRSYSHSARRFLIEPLENRIALDGDGFSSIGVRSLGSTPILLPNTQSRPSLATADFDNDGRDEIVIANGPKIQIFRSGQTTFTSPDIEIQDVRQGVDLYVADINGDGNTDIITVKDSDLDVRLHSGSEQGIKFADPIRSNLPATESFRPAPIHFEDVNGDGRDDLMVGVWESGVEVSLSRGDGTFDAGILFGTSSIFSTTDINADGVADLIIRHNFETEQVYLNDGSGLFEFWRETVINPELVVLPNVDIDGDGFDDRVGFREWEAIEFIVSLGRGNATWDPSTVTYHPAIGVIGGDEYVDINADGMLDVVFSGGVEWHGWQLDSNSGGTSVMLQTEPGVFSEPLRIFPAVGDIAVAENIVAISSEDEIEFVELISTPFDSISLLDRRGGRSAELIFGSPGIGPVKTEFIDANDDGHLDIARGLTVLSEEALSTARDSTLFLNNGDQTFSEALGPPEKVVDLPPFPRALTDGIGGIRSVWRTHDTSDFNGDGRSDVVLIDSSKHIGELKFDGSPNDWFAELSVWHREPTGQLVESLSLPGVGYAFDVTDLNDDENMDLVAITHQTSERSAELIIWHGSPEGLVEQYRLSAPAEVSFLRAIDVNEDGTKDFVMGSLDRNLTLLLSSDSGDYVQESVAVDQLIDDVFWGDFDLDGTQELLIAEFGTRFRPGGKCFLCVDTTFKSPAVTLTVLPKDADGNLGPPTYQTEVRAYSVNTMKVEDMDGDSDLDIVLGGDHLVVAWNNAADQPKLTLEDIHVQCEAIRSEEHRNEFDRNDDGLVDVDDLDELVRMEGNTRRGDTDLNGRVEFADFLQLSTNFGSVDAAWEDGDFDCDGSVTFADFLVLSSNFGFSQ